MRRNQPFACHGSKASHRPLSSRSLPATATVRTGKLEYRGTDGGSRIGTEWEYEHALSYDAAPRASRR